MYIIDIMYRGRFIGLIIERKLKITMGITALSYNNMSYLESHDLSQFSLKNILLLYTYLHYLLI